MGVDVDAWSPFKQNISQRQQVHSNCYVQTSREQFKCHNTDPALNPG